MHLNESDDQVCMHPSRTLPSVVLHRVLGFWGVSAMTSGFEMTSMILTSFQTHSV